MPKRHNNLYGKIIDFDNLYSAYKGARKGKRYRGDVCDFSIRLEDNLLALCRDLSNGNWVTGKAKNFTVYEPKRRDIQAPPFSDRVVHHALVRIVEPLFERKFIYHSYACRRDKGAQRAVKAVQRMLRVAQRNSGTVYVIKADIKSYFASIRHDVLLCVIKRTIKCKRTIKLWETILNGYGSNGVGIPVGALTSQLAANIMLDQLDHYLTDTLSVKNYVRYMDDFIVTTKNKDSAKSILHNIANKVKLLGLKLNPKTCIFPLCRGVDFCGYRTWPTHILPRKRNIKKMRRNFKKMSKRYSEGRATVESVRQRVCSFIAYAKHCSSRYSVQRILNETIFQRCSYVY